MGVGTSTHHGSRKTMNRHHKIGMCVNWLHVLLVSSSITEVIGTSIFLYQQWVHDEPSCARIYSGKFARRTCHGYLLALPHLFLSGWLRTGSTGEVVPVRSRGEIIDAFSHLRLVHGLVSWFGSPLWIHVHQAEQNELTAGGTAAGSLWKRFWKGWTPTALGYRFELTSALVTSHCAKCPPRYRPLWVYPWHLHSNLSSHENHKRYAGRQYNLMPFG